MYNPQLDTFMITAETGSFSRAARKLYITPSAVLQQINSLEEDLQVQLFTRTNRGLHLTPAGEYLVKEFPVLKEWNQSTRKKLRELNENTDGILRVAMPRMHKSRLFYQLWMEYTITHPQAKMEFDMASVMGQEDHVRAIDNSDLVEFIDDGEISQANKEFIKLCDIPLVFLAEKNHPLALKGTITREDLNGVEIRVPGGAFQRRYQKYYDKLVSYGAKLLPSPLFLPNVFDDSIIQRQITLAPSCSADMHPAMTVIRFDEQPTVPYGFVCNRVRTGVAADFIRFVEEEVRKQPIALR